MWPCASPSDFPKAAVIATVSMDKSAGLSEDQAVAACQKTIAGVKAVPGVRSVAVMAQGWRS
jgi:hypothetical protein